MSYSIVEWIDDLQRKLHAARVIHKRYSDARLHTLPDGSHVWISDAVVPENVDFIAAEKTVYVAGYVEIREVRVFRPAEYWRPAAPLFGKLDIAARKAFFAVLYGSNDSPGKRSR